MSRKAKQSRRLTVAGLIAVSGATLLMMAWAIFPSAAFADGTVNWTGNGSENNEPCGPNEQPGFHWVFTTGGGQSAVTDVDLFVNGNGPFQMSPNPQKTQWDADVVSGEVVSAHVDFVGSLGSGNAVLTISHGCFEEETTTTHTTTTTTTKTTTTHTTTTTTPTTTTTTPTTTTHATTTTYTTTTASPTVSPTSITSTTSRTKTPVVAPTTVKPGGTAFTGVEDVVPLGAIALTLLTGGSGLLWAGSRRRREADDGDE